MESVRASIGRAIKSPWPRVHTTEALEIFQVGISECIRRKHHLGDIDAVRRITLNQLRSERGKALGEPAVLPRRDAGPVP
ncbi:hypothetical protein D3C74_438300 [compost metagenome]